MHVAPTGDLAPPAHPKVFQVPGIGRIDVDTVLVTREPLARSLLVGLTLLWLTGVIGSAIVLKQLIDEKSDDELRESAGILLSLVKNADDLLVTAAVLGGIGNLAGAVVGGILLGIIESLGAGYIGDLTGGVLGSQYQDVFAFLVLILVLVFRPSGLMGERVSERP